MRIASNTRPVAHQTGGAVREGAALLQGLATCGHCGRSMRTHYSGRQSTPAYHCPGKNSVEGRGVYCLNIGGLQIDQAVTDTVLQALQPAGLKAALRAAQQLESGHDAALEQWRLNLERARYDTQRAQRRYHAVDAENRLVARGLEAQWERCLNELEDAQRELEQREQRRPRTLSACERKTVLALGQDLPRVWHAPTTTVRDRKELLRTVVEEFIITAPRDEARAYVLIRWRGGQVSECTIERPRKKQATVRTDEESVALVRRLATHHPDAIIAGM